MSESSEPHDLPGLDPEQFVGEPPAGEQDPTAFESDDQSVPDTGSDADADADSAPDDDPAEDGVGS